MRIPETPTQKIQRLITETLIKNGVKPLKERQIPVEAHMPPNYSKSEDIKDVFVKRKS